MERNGNWMQTFTGRAYWPIDPRADEVDIRDIAHALSMLCRYTGHCKDFYSVAEHSIIVSTMVEPEHAMQALLHDAAEAYCNDIARPLKRSLVEYPGIERTNWLVIAERFGVPHVEHHTVKQADDDILLSEAHVLLGPHPRPWRVPGAVKRDNILIECLLPRDAERQFLKRFIQLGGTV